jgi:hypothetical protein
VLRLLAKLVGLRPNWQVRLARGYRVVVRLNPGFELGTIVGGNDFELAMKRDSNGWRERVRGFNSGVQTVTDFEGVTSANPMEGTLSIFGAVFRFSESGQVFYERNGRKEQVGELCLPSFRR